MLRYPTHAGLLGQVRVVSSVSGGSIANGLAEGAIYQHRDSAAR
jgi:hypothetical protein